MWRKPPAPRPEHGGDKGLEANADAGNNPQAVKRVKKKSSGTLTLKPFALKKQTAQ